MKQRDRVVGPERDWLAGWESNRQAGLDAVVSATPAQRLAWLEDALRLAHRVSALPKRDEPPAVDALTPTLSQREREDDHS